MKSKILLGAIVMALLALGCQKDGLFVQDHMSPRAEIRPYEKDSITGVWKCTKQLVPGGPWILWSGWDEDFNPLGCYLIDPITGDTMMRWDFTFDSVGNMLSNGKKTFSYWPGINKLHYIMDLSGNPESEFIWNSTLDTVYKYIDDSFIMWYEVDSVDNILSASNTFSTYTYMNLLHPNIHIHYAPTSFFESPYTTFNIMDKEYNHDGIVIGESIVDSVVDGRVYKLQLPTGAYYNYEWTFLTYNAR